MNKIFPLSHNAKTWFNYSSYLNWTYEKIQSLEDYLKYFNPDYIILNESMSIININNLEKKDTEVKVSTPEWTYRIIDGTNSREVSCYFPSELYYREGYVNEGADSYLCFFAPPNGYNEDQKKEVIEITQEDWDDLVDDRKIIQFPMSRVVFSNKWRHRGVQSSLNDEAFNPDNYTIIAKTGAALYTIQSGVNKLSFKYEKNALETVGTIIPFVFEILPTRFFIKSLTDATWGSGAQSWVLDAADWDSISDLDPDLKITNKNAQLWTGAYPLMSQLVLLQNTDKENQIYNYDEFITDETSYITKVNIKNHTTARYVIITTNTSKEVGSLWTKVHVIVC